MPLNRTVDKDAIARLHAQGLSGREIARQLGYGKSAVCDAINKGTDHFAPPAGFSAKGVSTLHGPDGEIKAQWVKSVQGQHSPEEWAKIVKDAFSDTEPVKLIKAPKGTVKELLTVYPIGDQHHGMHAWAKETGDDYDLKISSRLLTAAAQHLVDIAPASPYAIIVNVGDFFHVDNLINETARNHNKLDVDTRYAAIIHSGVKMLRAVIESALSKHQTVKVINSPGNHDDIGALWLSLALGCLYEKNPRVVIEQAPGKFHYHRHGKTLIGVTHGDTLRLEVLAGVMATDRAEDWGQTLHRYWLTGHIHHRKVLELAGCMVESFRTLAAKDAWATAGGYRAGRDMNAIVYHAEHGEVARHRFDVTMAA